MDTSANANLELVKVLFEADLHLGHKKNRLHPKARKFVYRIDNGVSIIDLTQTAKQLNSALEFLKKEGAENKKLLVVATKKVANQIAMDVSKKNTISYITTKWLPGLLTNFETIIKNVKKLNEMKSQRDSGEWDKLTKHERVKLSKQIARLEKFYGGIATLEKRPDILFVIDSKKEHNAVVEAQKNNIPVIAITDTNSDPDEVAYPIVANDDSPKSIEYLVNTIIETFSKK